MTSAHLPRGTKIEAIPGAKRMSEADRIRWRAPKVREGVIYTVRDYFIHPKSGEIGVRLNEIHCPTYFGIEWGFKREGFRVVQLPKLPAEILSCLNVDPEQARVLMPEDA